MIEDVQPGLELGPSAWREVTQERIDAFADATDDPQWIHVDPELAAAGPFGTTIAHGYLTLVAGRPASRTRCCAAEDAGSRSTTG